MYAFDLGVGNSYNIFNMNASHNFNVIFKPEPEGGFTAIVPSLPGCVTYGKTLVEARGMAADAIEGYIASLVKHNEPIPSDEDVFVGMVNISPGTNHQELSRFSYA